MMQHAVANECSYQAAMLTKHEITNCNCFHTYPTSQPQIQNLYQFHCTYIHCQTKGDNFSRDNHAS